MGANSCRSKESCITVDWGPGAPQEGALEKDMLAMRPFAKIFWTLVRFSNVSEMSGAQAVPVHLPFGKLTVRGSSIY